MKHNTIAFKVLFLMVLAITLLTIGCSTNSLAASYSRDVEVRPDGENIVWTDGAQTLV